MSTYHHSTSYFDSESALKHYCYLVYTWKRFSLYNIQIMNGYECNGTDIFMR